MDATRGMTGESLAGRYRLEEKLASGGMATVWRARDEVLRRPVAVKILHDGLAEDGVAAERFRREALTAASISHPNMANVYDYVEENGRPGIVMELVEGETLGGRLAREGAMPIATIVGIADLVLAALETAHRNGIVHRDVKPGNILLTREGNVKVADFGIARAKGDATLTATGTVMGTAHYSSPEQVRGEPATPQSDLYSLGIVLYEMLTGERPFNAETPVAVAMKRLSEDPPPPRALRPDVPEAIEAVVKRALARDPAERFSSAAEMRAALAPGADRAAERTAVLPVGTADADTVALGTAGARPVPTTDELARLERPPPVHRGRFAVWMMPGFVLGLLVLGILLLMRGDRTARVPDFEGKTFAQAQSIAERAGLEVGRRTVDSALPKETVVGQSVAASSVVASGTRVTLEVSDGTPACCRVPNVEGMTRAAARRAIESASLEVRYVSFRIEQSGQDGVVVDQDPEGGTFRARGGNVDLEIRRVIEEKGKGKGRDGGDDDGD